jgi:phosphoribosylanthranilate isomerase
MNPHRTRIKICGLRDAAMARVSAEAGADAVGIVFHPASPRHASLQEAMAVAGALPAFVQAVGLFVNSPEARVREILAAVPLSLLQFHGDEDPDFCARFGLPWLKAVRVGPGTDLLDCQHRFSRATALLLDANVPGEHGGTGALFDWSVVPREIASRIVLSGGLHPGNVGTAVSSLRPWAVDVSSGVESSRGVKDAARIQQFVRSVKDADARTAC